ncbi:MAG TPA: Sapep family Mn(2+)-dependent dipeptidase, partial [Bacillota bacterium]|nr:Sapep family Mn(2+)-dependent dipeptidase [Bacillota bacterium]
DNEKKALLEYLSALIAIPSVKSEAHPEAPYGIAPKMALDFFLERAANDGFITKNIDNKAGYAQWGQSGPLIAVLCHLDVVPSGDGFTTDPFMLTEKDGMLYGRGVVDDKGPLSASYFSLLRIKNEHPTPNARYRLIVGTDEEHGSSCMERYVETEEIPDAGFTPDADFPCLFAEKGIMQIAFRGEGNPNVTIHGGNAHNMVPALCTRLDIGATKELLYHGICAHASRPTLGKNAIEMCINELPKHFIDASPLLHFAYDKLVTDIASSSSAPLLADVPADESGAITSNIGVIEVNANESVLHIDIRYPVNVDGDALLKAITQETAAYGLTVTIDGHQKPLYKEKNSPTIHTLVELYDSYRDLFPCIEQEKEAHDRYMSEKVEAIAIGGGTYARTMDNIVAFGPANPWEEDQCHQANEHIAKESLFILIPLYEEALEKLASDIIS